MTGLHVRPVTDDELPALARATETPFFEEVDDAQVERARRVVEPARTLAAFDGDRIVGGSLLFRMAVTVPGGELPTGGLSWVGILPTHRRRGLLTGLLQRHLEDMREWGEPLSALYASESSIYGRFGYGSAAPAMMLEIEREGTAFRPDVPVEDDVALVEPEEALRDFPAIYDAVRAQRPGMPDRDAGVWLNWLGPNPGEDRGGMSAKYLARLGDRGYLVYRATTGDWPHELPQGTMKVLEHMAVDTPAAATLWRYAFDHDLLRRFTMPHRPTDDLLGLLLANPRMLTGWQFDGMWLRLVDVPRSLAARTYSREGAVTFGVTDQRLPSNTASFRLEGGPDGATCARTDAEIDLRLDVADLSGAYLGNLKFTHLVRAGRAEEATPNAALRADTMFLTAPAPWSPQEF